MTQLLDLPSELLTEILSLLPAQDLSSFSQATSEAHDFVESPANAVLWRTVYLFLYDDPRLTGWRIKPYDPEKEVIDWKADTKRVTRAVIYIRSVGWRKATSDDNELPSNLLALIHLLYTSAPFTSSQPNSKNLDLLRSLPLPPLQFHPLIAQLAANLRSPLFHTPPPPARSLETARKTTYSLSSYPPPPNFGPFTHSKANGDEGGRVNWSVLNALKATQMDNFSWMREWDADIWQRIEVPWEEKDKDGRPFESRPVAIKERERDEVDWAGAQGEWMGGYAFVDFNDFLFFNDPRTKNLAFSREQEQVGNPFSITINSVSHLSPSLIPIHASSSSPAAPLPTLVFTGESSHYATDTEVRGRVSLTPDNQVRWTFIIAYGGQDRWTLEGVQIGGIGSSYGIVGVWTEAEREHSSPAGPFWFWKTQD